MENNVQYGHASLTVSIIGGMLAWIDFQVIDFGVKAFTGIISMAAGVMAIRYYHYNTKRIKNEIEKDN